MLSLGSAVLWGAGYTCLSTYDIKHVNFWFVQLIQSAMTWLISLVVLLVSDVNSTNSSTGLYYTVTTIKSQQLLVIIFGYSACSVSAAFLYLYTTSTASLPPLVTAVSSNYVVFNWLFVLAFVGGWNQINKVYFILGLLFCSTGTSLLCLM
jgi:hypothetical protein